MFIILLDMTVLASGKAVGREIGSPTALNSDSNSSQSSTDSPSQLESSYMTLFECSQPSTSTGISQDGLSKPVLNIHPINTLTSYQTKWTIKARVTNKSPVNSWSNKNGEGTYFSMTLVDEFGEIRATAFKEQCGKFYDCIEENKVYYISKGNIKPANKKYTTVRNDYEMTFNCNTTVVACDDDISNVPMLRFDFTPIANIQDACKGQLIDVMGICKSFADVQTVTTRKTGSECQKRDITLVDKSGAEVRLTLWQDKAVQFNGPTNAVVAVKDAQVSDYGGRSLSTLRSSIVKVNPDIPESHLLHEWYQTEGAAFRARSLTVVGGPAGVNTDWKTFAQVKAEYVNYAERPNYFNSKATVIALKRDTCLYQACPQDSCRKKVVDLSNGLFRCEKCSKEYNNYKWGLLLYVKLLDFSDYLWATCFQDTAETILEITAEELGRLKETDEDRFNEILNNANFKSFIFGLRKGMEAYNEKRRLKTVVCSACPVNSIQYGTELLGDIHDLEEILN